MAVSCVYIIFFNSQKSFSFLSNVPHIIKLKFKEIKNTVRVPSRIKLPKTIFFFTLFQQIYGDFVISFEIYVYFLASEDDIWVFLTSKNHGQSL